MRKLLLWFLFFLLPFLYSVYLSAQSKKEKDCSTTCFSSDVISVQKISDSCTSYELKVSFSGECAHELSHFTVAVPCGKIQNIRNSGNWAQEIGTDPTTGLSGFKIDNISDFGKGSRKEFIVNFTVCASGETCADQLSCWQPVVAYKASTCVNFETLTVTCSPLKASIEKVDVSCFGAQDGALSVVVADGKEPYAFLWSNNLTTQSVSGLSTGTYSVIVRDASGAERALEETIEQPSEILISGTSTPATCNGVADGSIDISVSGGSGAYTFGWSNGAQTADIPSLAPGQYTVTVKDENNCAATKSFAVGSTSTIQVTGTHVKPDCNDTNGSLNISVIGGTGPYTFEWSNGASTEDLQSISAGVYTVVVTDNAGCSARGSFYIKDNNTLSLNGITTPTGCNDDGSGTVDLSVSGGTPPYTFTWSNGESIEDLSNLASGYYTVTVKDSRGCTASAGFVVSKNSFQVSATVVQPSCHDAEDASITLQEPVGGTAPYTYQWTGGGSGTSLTNLGAGTYTVIVTDEAGCSRTLTYTIKNPLEIFAAAAVSNTQCNADGPYSVDLTPSGGTAPYTYEWSNGNTTEDVEGLDSGSYTVEITDSRGCNILKEIVVERQGAVWACLIDQLAENPSCGSVDNTISTSVTDADSYSWSIESTDGQWSLIGGNSASIAFTAGGENSAAIFTLTIQKDGCTQTCTYTVAACIPEDNGGGTDPGEEPGGEEPGGENPGEAPGDGDGGSQTCEECFNTVATIVETSSTCRTYDMVVNTNGLCRHDLSHWTLAIPCGSVSSYSNSEGWKMEFGKDPTTGLYGLKVDNINDFGKKVDTFTVRLTVCENNGCDLSLWKPTVAYKAGLCVGFETTQISPSSQNVATVSVYPNPFNEKINFEWTADHELVSLEIIDQYGNSISNSTTPTGRSQGYYITLESSALPKGMYYYRLTIDGKVFQGKISKR
ncbi:MAG: T9SS type A sorting domain-containing protein [Chryseosolibacter sp.]